jgi:hypothetical protein
MFSIIKKSLRAGLAVTCIIGFMCFLSLGLLSCGSSSEKADAEKAVVKKDSVEKARKDSIADVKEMNRFDSIAYAKEAALKKKEGKN